MRKTFNYRQCRGIWISQFDWSGILTEGGTMRAEKDYRAMVEKMLGNVAQIGCNTVFLQVRPNGDSFYPSDVYPPSKYAVGAYGSNFLYDPLPYFIEQAHLRNLSVQAWINPYRLMTETEIEAVVTDCVLWKSYTSGKLKTVAGRLYFDPADAEARKIICRGAEELLRRYHFDGLHLDDYFYPTTDASFDADSFASSGEKDLSAFRIRQVTALVRDLSRVVHGVSSSLVFGISPAGNPANLLPLYFADVAGWCAENLLDYVLPQIYFGMKHGSCPFPETVRVWETIAGNTTLWIGISLGKAVNGEKGTIDPYAVTAEGQNEWIEQKNVVARCLQFLHAENAVSGWAIFCYSYLFHPQTGEDNGLIAEEKTAFLPLIA